MSIFRYVAAAVLLALTPVSASASLLINDTNFNNACSGSGLTCVGNTTTVGGALQLTPASSFQGGAAYSTVPVTLGSAATFSSIFQFQFTNAGGVDPADGIVFVLAENTAGIGGSGYGMGYLGLSGNSVAIRFDTYYNNPAIYSGLNDPNSNFVGVDINGSLTDTVHASPYGVTSCGFTNGNPPQSSYQTQGCMSNGDVWTATIGYDGATHGLTVSVRDGNGAAVQVINTTIDIASVLGSNSAFVGFTSSTGAGWQDHDILNWQVDNTTALVPEPTSLVLLGGGLLGLAVSRRNRTEARVKA